MSEFSIPDALGPIEVLAPNLAAALQLRATTRVHGGVTVDDDAGAMRSRMRFPDNGYSVATVNAAALFASTTPWAEGISAADLVRLDNQSADGVLEGVADAVPLGSYYYSVRAVPNKPIKVLANVGSQALRVQPPSAPLSDPNSAGIFLDSITLTPGLAVAVVWDAYSFGYRIQRGERTYVTYEGQYVVYLGQRIYYRGSVP